MNQTGSADALKEIPVGITENGGLVMNKLLNRIIVFTVFAFSGAAVADPPVSLHIEAPSNSGDLALLSESGWPITIRLDVELPPPPEEGDPAPFPAYAVQPNFPVWGDWGFLIFDDPDGCLNPPAPSWQPQPTPECGVPDPLPSDWDFEDWEVPESDETYLEFWPDVDLAGAPDNAGNEDRQEDLLDSNSSGGPEFNSWSGAGVLTCTPDTADPDCDQFGPDTGGETTDGYGIGANDDLPGLVVIAQYGIGNTYIEPDFEQTSPVGARNLAGLVNSVAYELSVLEESRAVPPRSTPPGEGPPGGEPPGPPNNVTEFSRIWAHLNMPPGVVRHIIQYDACVGEPIFDPPGSTSFEECTGDDLWRVDGGPVETAPMNFERPDAASIDLLESTVFEIRAFLVAGQAPNELLDWTGDGIVDSGDAEAAGYTVLTNEDSIEFLQLSQLICFGGGMNAVYFDLDGNGEAIVPIECGAGPGDLSRPPR